MSGLVHVPKTTWTRKSIFQRLTYFISVISWNKSNSREIALCFMTCHSSAMSCVLAYESSQKSFDFKVFRNAETRATREFKYWLRDSVFQSRYDRSCLWRTAVQALCCTSASNNPVHTKNVLSCWSVLRYSGLKGKINGWKNIPWNNMCFVLTFASQL